MEKLWWVSEFNKKFCVNKRRLKIYDTTLRDGEQTVGVSFSAEEKLKMALELEKIGVDRIETGMPVISEEDMRAAKMIVEKVKKAEVFGFCRCVKKDIDACLETGVKAVTCELPVSEYKWKAYGYTKQSVFNKLLETIKYAKDNGLYVAYFAVDATRAELETLEAVYKTAVEEAGADEVVLVDTLGAATPETMAYLTGLLKKWVNVPIMVHCHNDFGLATACTLAALNEGAEYAQVTVNGLGEKSGNADLAEVVMTAKLLYDYETKIDISQLNKLSTLVSKLSQVPISPQKPIVGERIFTKESGIAVAQLLTYPPAVETFDPSIVGRKRDVVLSKKSGKGSLKYVLREMGVEIDENKLEGLLSEVKELGLRKKGPITKKEFQKLLKKYL